MAHHLARLMKDAKAAAGEAKQELERQCCDAVLAIWKHRNCLPEGVRPFEPAERLLEIVAALDPDSPRPFYGAMAMSWSDLDLPDQPTDEEARRFDVVQDFDHAARAVMRYLLGRAVEDLPTDTREWVRRAHLAGIEDVDTVLLRRLISASDPSDLAQRRKENEIRMWRSRLEHLDRFLTIAEMVRADVARRLADVEQANKFNEA